MRRLFLATFLLTLAPMAGGSPAWAAGAVAPTTLTGNGETVTLAIAIAKVVGSLVVVVGLMFLALALIRKMGLGRTALRREGLVRVLESRMIAPKKYVAVVDIAGQCVALGVTEQQVTMLTRVDGEAARAAIDNNAAGPISFPKLLRQAGQRRQSGGER